MSKKSMKSPLAAAVGAAFASSLLGAGVAQAAENPFSMTELAQGYQVADAHMKEGKCGEGKCGGSKASGKEMQKEMGEGKCGTSEMGKGKEGQCGAMNTKQKTTEGKCGEGKCGGNK